MIFHIKRFFGKLNKRQLEDIGTFKSPTKPLYLTSQNIEKLMSKKKRLEKLLPIKHEMLQEIRKKEEEIINEEEMLEILQAFNDVSREARLEEEKIKVHEKSKQELINQKNMLESNLKEIKPVQKDKKHSNLLYNILGIIFVISTILVYILDNKNIGFISMVISVILFLIILIRNLRRNKKFNREQEEVNKQRKEMQNKIELIESDITVKEKLINENRQIIDINTKEKKEQIRLKYPKAREIDLSSNINITEKQNYINNLKLNLNKKEYEIKQITEELEELVEIEEKLSSNKELYKELMEYDETINIAKDALNDAYLEMKESITPKFTENLSKSIEQITQGKYKNIRVTDEGNLLLEAENGNYVTANYLSQSTVDVLYLSLRISSINELTNENMVVIFDETFAYFDENRLRNVLKFLNEYYNNKQIIILTCTDREIQSLNQIEVEYNKIIL